MITRHSKPSKKSRSVEWNRFSTCYICRGQFKLRHLDQHLIQCRNGLADRSTKDSTRVLRALKPKHKALKLGFKKKTRVKLVSGGLPT